MKMANSSAEDVHFLKFENSFVYLRKSENFKFQFQLI